jgi:hypothetical protein
MTHPPTDPIRDLEAYLTKYLVFPEPAVTLPLALWVAHTYLWESFDVTPYLVITSDTKRSGKTRLSELLGFTSHNGMNVAAMTPATIYHILDSEKATLFIDEAETFSSGALSTIRTALNMGYRKGQTIPRMSPAGTVVQWNTYCPKCFVLIGDVHDTLRDRSIVVRMQRADAPTRFLRSTAEVEGKVCGDAIRAVCKTHRKGIIQLYDSSQRLDFLNDRDEEIWLPLFAVMESLCPDRANELVQIAVDLSTDKTGNARRATSKLLDTAEKDATNAEYGERLAADLLTVIGNNKSIFTADAIEQLKALPTGPWRRFKGHGLSTNDLARLLSPLGIQPCYIRVGGKNGKGGTVKRGYRRENVAR